MLNNTLVISDEDRDEQLSDRQSFHFPESRFNFINEHFGLRNGKVHTLISSSGAGKSTLARSLLLDMARSSKVFLYSTEEDKEDTQTMLSMRGVSNEILNNINFLDESELAGESKNDLKNFFRILEVNILNTKSKVLFFDNITTSSFYEPFKPDHQADFFTQLRELAKRLSIPVFLIAHTSSSVKDDQQGLIRAEDIWGSKSPARKSQFLYVFQRFIGKTSGESTPMFGIVRVLKARGYDTHNVYLLNYKWDSSEYIGDKKIPNEKFKELYDDRFKLGK